MAKFGYNKETIPFFYGVLKDITKTEDIREGLEIYYGLYKHERKVKRLSRR